MALGVVGTAPREYPDLRTVLVDLDPAGGSPSARRRRGGRRRRAVRRRPTRSSPTAAGGGSCPTTERTRIEPAADEPSRSARGGNYLVTGGLGGVGFALARHLAARRTRPTSSSSPAGPCPRAPSASEWLARHGYDDPTSRRIRRLAELESLGTKVTVVAADLADPDVGPRRALERGRAARRPARRRDPRRRRAARPADRAGDRTRTTRSWSAPRRAARSRSPTSCAGAAPSCSCSISSTSHACSRPRARPAYVAANSVLDALAGDRGDAPRASRSTTACGPSSASPPPRPTGPRLGIDARRAGRPSRAVRAAPSSATARSASSARWPPSTTGWSTSTARRPARRCCPAPATSSCSSRPSDARGRSPATAVGSVTLLEPLVVPDGVPVTVRVTVGAGRRGRHALGAARERRRRRPLAAAQRGPARRRAGRARASRRSRSRSGPTAPPTSTRSPGPARSSSSGRAGARSARRGATATTSSDACDSAEQYAGELDAWLAHPALVDVATAFGVLARRARDVAVRARRLRR